MVRDGYYYGLDALVVALLLGWLTTPARAGIPVLLGAFFCGSFETRNGKSRQLRGQLFLRPTER